GRQAINRITSYIEKTALDLFADRHCDRYSSIDHLGAPHTTFGSIHRNTTNTVFAKVLLHLKYKRIAIFTFELKGVINFRELTLKLYVNNGSDNLFYLTYICHILVSSFWLVVRICNQRFS